MKPIPPRSLIAWILIALMAQSGFAQAPAPPAAPASTLPVGSLHILVLDGANAVNSIPNRSATFPVVEIRDENDLPIEGVEVSFELPASGPGGTFPNQKTSFSGRTNLQGQVRAPYIMNSIPGDFTIQVTASIGSRTGKVTISQTHSMQTPEQLTVVKKPLYKSWKLWAIAGAAAATGIILGTRGSSTPATPTITITPGGPTIAGPR